MKKIVYLVSLLILLVINVAYRPTTLAANDDATSKAIVEIINTDSKGKNEKITNKTNQKLPQTNENKIKSVIFIIIGLIIMCMNYYSIRKRYISIYRNKKTKFS